MKLSATKIKKALAVLLWIIIGCGSTFLLVAAAKKNGKKECKNITVNITGVSNNYFVDKKDVEEMITRYAGKITGQAISAFDLKRMESELKNNIWIKESEMFFDNNGVLQVNIDEREPVARVFTVGTSSFYIDSSLVMLPLSDKFSPRLPVFTGFPTEAKVLKRADSALLKDVLILSTQIQKDPFLMGMIDQVDITSARNFEMLPKIGNQVIVFGDAVDASAKFNKLKLFYKKVITKTGWNHYSVINLQYKDQVVGKIRSADDVTADSLRTVQMMHLIAMNAELRASDSIKTFAQDSEKNTADSSMILHSIQRDEEGGASFPETAQPPVTEPVVKEVPIPAPTQVAAAPKQVIKKAVSKPVITNTVKASKAKAAVANKQKQAITKPKQTITKPKAVYKAAKNNDY